MTIDYEPLRSHVSASDVVGYYKSMGNWKTMIVGVVFVGIIVLALAVPLASIFLAVFASGDIIQSGVAWVLALLVVVGIAYAILNATKQAVRIRRFAHANNFGFVSDVNNPSHSGLIFNQGRDRVQKIGVILPEGDGREIEFGRHEYVVGSGKNRRSVDYGFIRIALSRRLPHMVLDARSNNFLKRFSNLPASFDKSQRLSLEGDFDSYFSLYAPKKYERDALYALTPEVMAALIDGAKAYDLEIIDNQLFIYSTTPFDLHKQEVWEKLLVMARKISQELNEQIDYYADEKVGDRSANIIAEPGRRLSKGINWIVVAIIVYIVISFGMQLFFGFSSR